MQKNNGLFKASHWTERRIRDELSIGIPKVMSTPPLAIKAELGSMYCRIHFHLWTGPNWTTQANNWWRQTIPSLPWKTHMFRCVDILTGRKANVLPKTRQASILKLRNDGFPPVLHTIKGLPNAMGFTLATEFAPLHLHRPSWIVQNHLSSGG